MCPNLGDRHLGLRPHNPDMLEAYGDEASKANLGNAGTDLRARGGGGG